MKPDTAPPTLSGRERVILELLAGTRRGMYGLELVAHSDGRLKRGTVYVTLGRMQQKGFVEAEPEKFADDSGLVPRRIYHATPHGMRVLRAWATVSRALAWEAGL